MGCWGMAPAPLLWPPEEYEGVASRPSAGLTEPAEPAGSGTDELAE